jgi:CRP/FNR family transcriptional regulator, cyclic AMP receptor protein
MTTQPQTLIDHLRSTIWGRALTAAEMTRVEADCFEQFVPKGGYVCRKGEVTETWVGIIEGLVKINNFSPEGKSVTFTGVPPGGWFGEGSLLKNEARKYDVMALRDTRVARQARAPI